MSAFAAELVREFDVLLQERRAELLTVLRERLHQGDDPEHLALANYFEAFSDQAEADSQSETNLAQLSHELGELRALDAALARVAAGTYGSCANCGETIALARLRVQPVAHMCLRCQEEIEQHPGRQQIKR